MEPVGALTFPFLRAGSKLVTNFNYPLFPLNSELGLMGSFPLVIRLLGWMETYLYGLKMGHWNGLGALRHIWELFGPVDLILELFGKGL